MPLLVECGFIDADSVCHYRLVELLKVVRPDLEFMYHTVGIGEDYYNLLVFQRPNRLPVALYKNLDDDELMVKLCEYITFKR